jgi:hypothetical protein
LPIKLAPEHDHYIAGVWRDDEGAQVLIDRPIELGLLRIGIPITAYKLMAAGDDDVEFNPRRGKDMMLKTICWRWLGADYHRQFITRKRSARG